MLGPMKARPIFSAVLALVVAGGILNALSFWPLTIDDAYISLRYAHWLLEGEGLVYNPGERVEGFSNPTWVLLMAATLATGAPSLAGGVSSQHAAGGSGSASGVRTCETRHVLSSTCAGSGSHGSSFCTRRKRSAVTSDSAVPSLRRLRPYGTDVCTIRETGSGEIAISSASAGGGRPEARLAESWPR